MTFRKLLEGITKYKKAAQVIFMDAMDRKNKFDHEVGTIEKVLSDGTYTVKFKNGTLTSVLGSSLSPAGKNKFF